MAMMRHFSTPIGVVLATALSACGTRPAPPAVALPLGPAPEVRLGVRGAANSAPSLATRGPYVALAWTSRVAGGKPDIYVSTSVDNGASFSKPRRVDASSDRANIGVDQVPRITLDESTAGTQDRPVMPVVSVAWMPTTGRSLISPEVLDSIGGPPATHVQTALDESKTLVAVWDETDGASRRVVLRRLLLRHEGVAQALSATVLAREASATSPVVAAIPGGVIVAWVSGDPAASVIVVRRVGLETICFDVPQPHQDHEAAGTVHAHE